MTTLVVKAGDYQSPAIFQAQIQSKIDSGKYDQIVFESKGMSGGDVLIGPNTIKINGPMKIGPGTPNIRVVGTSGSTIKDRMDCGIFSITGDGAVKITGLRLLHVAGVNPHYQPNQDLPWYPNIPNVPPATGFQSTDDPGMRSHGSGTIAWFVDNTEESALEVTDCEIITTATAAIDIEAINEPTDPLRHDLIVRNCRITGMRPGGPIPSSIATIDDVMTNLILNHPLDGDWLAGNWMSVKLGPMPPSGESIPAWPVDLRHSYVEIADCTLDPATFAGIGIWRCYSDTETELVMSSNQIGQQPGAGSLSFGVFVGFPFSDLPKGTALISDNRISVADCFDFGGVRFSAGISVEVNNDDVEIKTRTVIVDNAIGLLHPKSDKDPSTIFSAGIMYNDTAAGGSESVSALIENNKITGGAAAPPRWGIALRGSAHDMVVRDNHLETLQAGVAQIYIEPEAHNGIFSENLLGTLMPMSSTNPTAPAVPQEAVLLCDGGQNRFFDNDFSFSGIHPGWDTSHAGPGLFKLGNQSKENILVTHDLDAKQYLDAVTQNTTNHWFQI